MALTVISLSPASVTPYHLLESFTCIPLAVCRHLSLFFRLTVAMSNLIFDAELLEMA